MSLVVNLESLQGLGAVGDRVARVIFRGNEEDVTFEISVHEFIVKIYSGVSKVSQIFEQTEEVSVISQVF